MVDRFGRRVRQRYLDLLNTSESQRSNPLGQFLETCAVHRTDGQCIGIAMHPKQPLPRFNQIHLVQQHQTRLTCGTNVIQSALGGFQLHHRVRIAGIQNLQNQ